MVEMIPKIMREEGEVAGLNLGRCLDLLLQVLGKRNDASLKSRVHGHVQGDVTPRI